MSKQQQLPLVKEAASRTFGEKALRFTANHPAAVYGGVGALYGAPTGAVIGRLTTRKREGETDAEFKSRRRKRTLRGAGAGAAVGGGISAAATQHPTMKAGFKAIKEILGEPAKAAKTASALKWMMDNPNKTNLATGAALGAGLGAITRRREGESKADTRKRRLKRMGYAAALGGGLSVGAGAALDMTKAGKKVRENLERRAYHQHLMDTAMKAK